MTRLVNTLDPDACTEEQEAIMHEYMIAFSGSEDNSDMEYNHPDDHRSSEQFP